MSEAIKNVKLSSLGELWGTRNPQNWSVCTKRVSKPQTLRSAEAKEKYREVFEIQKSGDKTSSGEIGLDIRTHASPKVGQDQVSGGVSVLC